MSVLTPYNVTINSQTASLHYEPYKDGDPKGGWNLTYTLIPDSVAAGTTASGISYHRTTFPGASMALTFTGTDVYLYGNASAGSYNVSIDGGTATKGINNVPKGGLLDAITNLDFGNHTVILASTGKDEVAFQHADVTIGIPSSGTPNLQTILAITTSDANSSNATSADVTGIGRGFNPFFGPQFSAPNWNLPDQFEFSQSNPTGSPVSIVPQGNSTSSSSSVTFTLTNTTAFFILGPLNHDHGLFQVTIIPEDDSNNEVVQIANGSSFLSDPQQVLYWNSGLNENTTYVIEVENTANGPSSNPRFGIRALVTISSTGGSSSTSSAGVVLGVVAVVLGITMAVILSLRRRFHNQRPQFDRNKLILERPQTTAIPFQHNYNPSRDHISPFWYQPQVYAEDSSAFPAILEPSVLPPMYSDHMNSQPSAVMSTTASTTSY